MSKAVVGQRPCLYSYPSAALVARNAATLGIVCDDKIGVASLSRDAGIFDVGVHASLLV